MAKRKSLTDAELARKSGKKKAKHCHAVEMRLRSHWESFVKGLKCPCTQLIDKLPIAIQHHAQLASLQTDIPQLIEKAQH